jgi:hypothetical protein
MKKPFKGLKRFISIERKAEREGKRQTTLSYHLSSLEVSARRFAHGIVEHRGGI